jgi:hypothetical protein
VHWRRLQCHPFPLRKIGGGSFSSRDYGIFRLSEQGLMDLPLSRGPSTWSNNSSWSRLNRFLVSPNWEAKYLGLFQKRVLDCALTIFLFSLTVMVFKRAKNLLNLRICG